MATQKSGPVYDNSFLRFLAESGVPLEDARWFHLKSVGQGFNTPADLSRVESILDLDQGAKAMLLQARTAEPRVVCA